MSKHDGMGRLLTRKRRFLNFLHNMGSVLIPPKIPDRSKEFRKSSNRAYEDLIKSETELAEMRASIEKQEKGISLSRVVTSDDLAEMRKKIAEE